ncbi:hypothetical protein HK101_006268 [Irineochytrium annulatum]|nr:hypothetical protein HK101_006268 [Irineochytrium annulatum]
MTTTRLYLKRGFLPNWSQKLFNTLPSEAFILEVSTLDPRSRTMTTTTRNLSHVGIMVVEERQVVRPMPGEEDGRTEMTSEARILANSTWMAVRRRVEDFSLSRIKDNTLKNAKGLSHVIEQLRLRKSPSI